MAEYLDKALLKKRFCGHCDDNGKCAEPCFDVELIENTPSAEVQPVRHGRWFMRGGKWRCSECDQKALLRLSDATGGCREYEYYRANYCPNCGAKMEGIE